MKTIQIYGCSDDLIEIRGDIRAETSPPDPDEPTKLAFSDGTILRVDYDEEGCWRIHRIATGTASMQKTEAPSDPCDYSDLVTLTGDIQWVAVVHQGNVITHQV